MKLEKSVPKSRAHTYPINRRHLCGLSSEEAYALRLVQAAGDRGSGYWVSTVRTRTRKATVSLDLRNQNSMSGADWRRFLVRDED